MTRTFCGLWVTLWLAASVSGAAEPDPPPVAREGSHPLPRLQAEQRIPLLPPGTTRHRVMVFTDIDCPYCSLLHRHAAEYLALGIRIDYLFYPRSGPGSAAFEKAVAIWCARDRISALDRAFSGSPLASGSCEHPVLRHYELARRLELRGTPAWLTEDGTVMYGALKPRELLRRLEVLADSASAAGAGG